MDDPELSRCHELLGLRPDCTREELETAYAAKSAATTDRVSVEAVRLAYNRISTRLRRSGGREVAPVEVRSTAAIPAPRPVREKEGLALLAFDNWKVNVLVPPLLIGLVWLVNLSPFVFFLRGFHVWMHEFGHATAAWMCGRRATPLPIGWTPVEPDYSAFVYFGLLLMFGILFAAGWKERKVWAMVAAVGLAALQYWMTWRLTERQQEFWWGAFGGVGGTFYLSALMMAFFYVELPEKFRWGACRYGFFLIGATALLDSTRFWHAVYENRELIPFGSMINGEEDENGDMNKLMALYGWKERSIRENFHHLAQACWIGLALVYAVFALRLNKVADVVVAWFQRGQPTAEEGR